ncbi:MerR family transcriptional regulator [Sphingomonas sp. RB56-2]|uniref:MerR family transcriptional regulator n=1 Tax=Sphingomonas brevis TaxID=2908206 RepID=A0ABT0SBY0_9SPHN|nr:MerR family transcriptional regulator [Sphingomonas brevis]MCL6741918.1 MerR family transcriptional regulator [Sphingomonas brevis]
MATGEKAPDAFRTIGELSAELGVAQHILRYWETKFPQLKPLQRAGNRRYYRPDDVALARRIHRLLNDEGYTVKGVQKLLRAKSGTTDEPLVLQPANVVPRPEYGVDTPIPEEQGRIDVERLMALRHRLAAALDA